MPHIIVTYFKVLLVIISCTGMVRYKKLTRPFKIVTLSVIATLLLSLLGSFLAVKYKNSLVAGHIGAICDYIFYSAAYYYLFKNEVIKKSIFVLVILFIAFGIINGLVLEPFNKMPATNILVPAQILYTLFSLLMFKQMLSYPLKVNIIKQSVFWYNTAILFFATTLFLISILNKYLTEHNVADYVIFYFWYGILYIFYILIGVSILIDNREISTAHA
jgi:hypothetical protein